MKRRDFISRSIVITSSLIPGLSIAARPCAPTILAEDGSGSPRPCEPGNAEEDWLQRTSGRGVVWFHDFRTDQEVDNFRWVGGLGNDPDDTRLPGLCIRNTDDGITGGGCLELIYPVGSSSAPGWWRPFSPLSGISNGRGLDDPGASGDIALRSWDSSNRSQNEQFRSGYYAHPSYIGQDGFSADQFDGSEFWLQFRIKIDPNRYLEGTPSSGKLSFIATTQQTLNQEIVHQNMKNRRSLWYTNFGSSPDTGGSMGVDGGTKQPGGDYSECGVGGDCWLFNGGEWVTFLYHVIPGTDGDKNTLFEAFAARQGQANYETIFSQMNTINFSELNYGHPKAYNSFKPSNYMNGQATTVAWYQRYDQIVFSREFIPCPQV